MVVDDDSTKTQVQASWVQHSMGPGQKHHNSVLHTTWLILGVTLQSQHCDGYGQFKIKH
jgi:hypothetical protein